MRNQKAKKMRSEILFKLVIYSLIIVIISGAFFGYFLWKRVFASNITTGYTEIKDIHINTGADMQEVFDLLEENDLIRNRSTLEWLAKRKNYKNHVRPGLYRLRDGMNNNELINMLRSGSQRPVNLVFINHRHIEDIALVVSQQIEADSSGIVELARDKEFIESLGFDSASIPSLFIPNTYEFYWNTSAEQFFRRMKYEYETFWNDEREKKRISLGLSRVEVITLASIIIEETIKFEEMPVIAGVYLNRLERGMRLQADPTIKYVIGDFTVNRILKKHLDLESPYNTYKYAGLPPGPIVTPSIQAIDAVLDAQQHEYLYFCARDDFSGYHSFAKTLTEHNRNARLYHNALNRKRVFR